MRGEDQCSEHFFTYVRLEDRIPADHPLRAIHELVDAALKELSQLLSSEHFSVDGTLIEAWASMKSFVPKDGSGAPPAGGQANGGRNAGRDFHGEKRANDTHSSTTDPDARLFRKGAGKEAKLCHMGHLMTENRNGLIVDARLTEADGTA